MLSRGYLEAQESPRFPVRSPLSFSQVRNLPFQSLIHHIRLVKELKMQFPYLTALALTLALANAMLDPALSNSKGRCPKRYNWYEAASRRVLTQQYPINPRHLTLPPANPPKSPPPSKPPSARTTRAPRRPRPSPSSKPTTSTTARTARRTAPATRTRARRPRRRTRCAIARTAGRSSGMRMPAAIGVLGRGVFGPPTMGLVGVRIAMGRLSMAGRIVSRLSDGRRRALGCVVCARVPFTECSRSHPRLQLSNSHATEHLIHLHRRRPLDFPRISSRNPVYRSTSPAPSISMTKRLDPFPPPSASLTPWYDRVRTSSGRGLWRQPSSKANGMEFPCKVAAALRGKGKTNREHSGEDVRPLGIAALKLDDRYLPHVRYIPFKGTLLRRIL